MHYVLSDVHGNRQRFDSIMEQIALQPEDTLYVLGKESFFATLSPLKERLQGTERVGIVPKGVLPVYCQSYFPGERVESFMNLPEENRAQFAQAARWQRLEPLELL